MANSDIPAITARTVAVETAPDDQLTRLHAENDQADQANFAAYSYGSPQFRHALGQLAANQNAAAEQDKQNGADEQNGADKPGVSAEPTATPEQIENQTTTIDPCTKLVIDTIPPPADRPRAMDSVKDRDPELFKQIQAKVTDPRYTGELGNITVSTHDKQGRINGCVFMQNVPYWESGPAAQSLVDVNLELAKRGKKLDADPLNGAGRTFAQEEAIVWRNSGLHAKVGKSNHGFGKAVDFKSDPDPDAKQQPWEDPFVSATLHSRGWRQGDTWGPLKNDLHHWSYVGPGPATDGPPRANTRRHHD